MRLSFTIHRLILVQHGICNRSAVSYDLRKDLERVYYYAGPDDPIERRYLVGHG